MSSTPTRSPLLRLRNSAEAGLKKLNLVKLLPHPNVITGRVRTSLAAAGLIAHPISPVAGTALYGANLGADWLDGMSARGNDQCTVEGAKLDPYVDKVSNAAYLAYIASQNLDESALIASCAASIAVDLYSQIQRGNVIEQTREAIHATLHPHDCTPVEQDNQGDNAHLMANSWGKIKFGLQGGAITAMLLAGETDAAPVVATASLSIAAILGYIGTRQRELLRR